MTLLMLLACAGTSDDTPGDDTSAPDTADTAAEDPCTAFWSFTVGTNWSYRYTDEDFPGSFATEIQSQNDDGTFVVVSASEQVNDSESLTMTWRTQEWTWSCDAEGLYRHDGSIWTLREHGGGSNEYTTTYAANAPAMMWAHDLEVGSTWTRTFDYVITDEDGWEDDWTSSVAMSVTMRGEHVVPAGTFNSVRVKVGDEHEAWVTEGPGELRMDKIQVDSTSDYELTAFEPGSPD